jgi:hypothetical protein
MITAVAVASFFPHSAEAVRLAPAHSANSDVRLEY